MYWDRIDPRAADLLRSWPARDLLRRFYLSGGTGLALQLGHRISVDVDFFTKEPAARIEASSIVQQLERHFPRWALSHRATDQLWAEISGVRVSFLAYPFRLRYALVEAGGVFVADARDIGLQKAYAIGRRATARDYIDLAWLIRMGILSIDTIIKEAQEVFVLDGEKLFSPKLFLQQLLYTEDLEDRDAVVKQLWHQETLDDLMQVLRDAVAKQVDVFADHREQERSHPDRP